MTPACPVATLSFGPDIAVHCVPAILLALARDHPPGRENVTNRGDIGTAILGQEQGKDRRSRRLKVVLSRLPRSSSCPAGRSRMPAG